MSLYKRGKTFWTMFVEDRTLYRKSLHTTKVREAKQRERDAIDAARRGSLTAKTQGPKTLFAAVDAYLAHKRGRANSERTPELEAERLSIVKGHFKDVRLSAITATAIAKYQSDRRAMGKSNRTTNMDIAALRRVLKHFGRWRALEQHVELLHESPSMIGRALTGEEQKRLFEAAASNAEWAHMHAAALVALNTTMRRVEVTHLQRRDVDLFNKTVTVRRSKNESSHRHIPLNANSLKAFAGMMDRADALGFKEPNHYLWFACKWNKLDPTRPMKKWDTAWRAVRDEAGLPGLRFHDLRHTAITELAEMGVADSVLKSIAGHITQRMLEHYSHIRRTAKRQALDGLDAFRAEEVLRYLAHAEAETVQ
jgi:integrase